MSGLQGKRWHLFVWDDDNETHSQSTVFAPGKLNKYSLISMSSRPTKRNPVREGFGLTVKAMPVDISE